MPPFLTGSTPGYMLRTFVTFAEFGHLHVVPVTVQEPGRFPTSPWPGMQRQSCRYSILSDYILSDELVDILQRLPEPWQRSLSSCASPFLEKAHRRRPQMSFNLTGVPQCGVRPAQSSLLSIDGMGTDTATRSPALFPLFPHPVALSRITPVYALTRSTIVQ